MARQSVQDRYGEGYAAGFLEGFRQGLRSVTLPGALTYHAERNPVLPPDECPFRDYHAGGTVGGRCVRCGVALPYRPVR